MRSIERVFNKISKLNPYWSNHTCFAEAVSERKFSRPSIAKWFKRLVDKDDYCKKDRQTLIKQLYQLSNPKKSS